MKARTIGASFDSFIRNGLVSANSSSFSASRGAVGLKPHLQPFLYAQRWRRRNHHSFLLADWRARDSSGAPQFETTLVTQTPQQLRRRANAFRTVRTPSFVHSGSSFASSDVVHVAGPALDPCSWACSRANCGRRASRLFKRFVQRSTSDRARGCACPGTSWRPPRGMLAMQFGTGLARLRQLGCSRFVRRFLCAHVAANITPRSGWRRTASPQSIAIPHGLEATEVAPRAEPRCVPTDSCVSRPACYHERCAALVRSGAHLAPARTSVRTSDHRRWS